jgi:hypothetical protein
MPFIDPSSAQPSPQPQGPSASGSLGQYTFTRAEVKGLSQVGVFLRKAADYLKHVFTQFSFVKPAISLNQSYFKTQLVIANNKRQLVPMDNVKMMIDSGKNAVDLSADNFQGEKLENLKTELSKWIKDTNTESPKFFSLPIGTFIGKEAHAVTVLICKDTQQILVLDGKGADPKDLKISKAGIKQTPSETTLDDVLKMVVGAVGNEFTVTGCPNFQKSMDCAIVAAVMQKAAIDYRTENPGKSIDLSKAIEPIATNYKTIDGIAIDALRQEMRKKS